MVIHIYRIKVFPETQNKRSSTERVPLMQHSSTGLCRQSICQWGDFGLNDEPNSSWKETVVGANRFGSDEVQFLSKVGVVSHNLPCMLQGPGAMPVTPWAVLRVHFLDIPSSERWRVLLQVVKSNYISQVLCVTQFWGNWYFTWTVWRMMTL